MAAIMGSPNGQVDLDEQEVITIPFAGIALDVLPQPPIYLYRRARRIMDTLTEGLDAEGADKVEWLLGEQGHFALGLLIPDLEEKVPLHAWMGYATEAEYEAGGDPDESQPPHPPTMPDLKRAFRAFVEVNGYDFDFKQLFERLFGAMDPTMRQELQESLAMDLTSLATSLVMRISPSAEDGSEASTSSSETSPTETEPASD